MTSSQSWNNSIGGVSLDGVSVSFGDVRALDGVSFGVEPGERLAVIGASGAGKSTLFRALTRSVPLRSGNVVLGKHDLYSLSRRELKAARRRVGVVYQAYNLIPQLPAGINAALGEVGGMGSRGTLRTLISGPDKALSARIKDAFERLGLQDVADTRTTDLSGGQQQRVAVARLLVQRPGLVLADEPFAAVDPVTTEQVMDALLDLNGDGATLLANLHDVEIARRFPRVVALREGRVVFDGPPKNLSDEELTRIYAGDLYGASAKDGAQTQDARHCREDSVRISGGRDGISTH